jgi:hypothetical protein
LGRDYREVRMARWRERGAGNLGCILGLALVAVVVVIGVNVVPVRIAVAELQDFCEKEAERASMPRNTDEKMAQAIFQKAVEERLAVHKENIKVWRDTGQVHVEVKYRVVLDLLVYKYDWDVEHKVERTLF